MKIEDLNLAALKYFLDAVELNSITASSIKNNVSRPAVSQAIIRLESWYGAKLLKHEKRNFELTNAGRKFYQKSKKSFSLLETDFKDINKSEQSLRFGCSASLIDLVFPALSPIIAKAITLTIKIGKTSNLLELLDSNEIGFSFLINDGKELRYKSKVVHRGQFELRSTTGTLSPLLVTTETRPETKSLIRFLTQSKRPLEQHIEVESWILTQRIAELTNGMCLVPDYLPEGNFRKIKTPTWKCPYEVLLVSNETKELTDLESEFIENIKKI